MKNKDVLAMEKAKIVEQMNQAIQDDDPKAFSEAFTELCQRIETNVLEQAKELMQEQCLLENTVRMEIQQKEEKQLEVEKSAEKRKGNEVKDKERETSEQKQEKEKALSV